MKDWKSLIGRRDAEELYRIVNEVHKKGINNSSKNEKEKINKIANALNDEGFDDTSIERFVDWYHVWCTLNKK
jgi:nitrogen regulatory protein PII-like uncharacterized protein